MKRYNIEKRVLDSLYEVTESGDIYRRIDNYKYKPSLDTKGYLRVRLPYPQAKSSDGRYPFKVHRLIAMFHLNTYSEQLQVNHKNGNKQDNRVENLEMVTNRENILHAWRVLDSTERRRKISETYKKKRQTKLFES